MAPSNSLFQLLPYDIVEVIIGYLPPKDNTADRKIKVAIIHLCHIWRTVYMRKYLSYLVFRYHEQSKEMVSFEKMPQFISPLVYPIDQLVRTLTLDIVSWEPLMSGEILSWMQKSPVFFKTNLAPVKTLILDTVRVCKPYFFEQSKALVQINNIAAFFRYVKSLTPDAKIVKLSLSEFDEWLMADRNNQLIEKSITDLVYGGNFKFSYKVNHNDIPLLNPTAFSMLTSLDLNVFSVDYSPRVYEWGCEVTRRNALTLRNLKLHALDLEQLEMFLFKNEAPIIYSSLAKMDIYITDRTDMFNRYISPISNSYAENHEYHFPILKSLKFYGPYIMAIGCLFGSVNRSLEYFDANICHEHLYDGSQSIDLALDLTRFYNLKIIKFAVDSYCVSSELNWFKKMCYTIFKSFSGSPSAAYYISFKILNLDNVLEILDYSNVWATLWGLDIQNFFCSLLDIINLLKNAPMLQSLICNLSDKPPEIDGVNLIGNPEFLKEHHYPLSTAFSKFKIVSSRRTYDINIYNVSWSTVLLATVCPKLRNVKIFYYFRGMNPCDICVDIYDNIDITKAAKSLCKHINTALGKA